jgi:hypothetical protein
MEKGSWTPPDFLGIDTSHTKLKKIPPLTLGLPKLYPVKPVQIFVATIRVRDVSGNQPAKR